MPTPVRPCPWSPSSPSSSASATSTTAITTAPTMSPTHWSHHTRHHTRYTLDTHDICSPCPQPDFTFARTQPMLCLPEIPAPSLKPPPRARAPSTHDRHPLLPLVAIDRKPWFRSHSGFAHTVGSLARDEAVAHGKLGHQAQPAGLRRLYPHRDLRRRHSDCSAFSPCVSSATLSCSRCSSCSTRHLSLPRVASPCTACCLRLMTLPRVGCPPPLVYSGLFSFVRVAANVS